MDESFDEFEKKLPAKKGLPPPSPAITAATLAAAAFTAPAFATDALSTALQTR